MTDQQLRNPAQADSRVERIAAAAEQIDLDPGAAFNQRYVESPDVPGSSPA